MIHTDEPKFYKIRSMHISEYLCIVGILVHIYMLLDNQLFHSFSPVLQIYLT